LRGRLVDYFENEKPYLRPDLTIQQVALYLYSNKTYLSRIINECFDNNFNQFVNYHRVEEAKRLFYNDPKLSIQQLCDLSGFGSMATFSIAFRFFVGNSPADWCKEQKIKGLNDKKGRD
jgi:AraC-like DNA-binding protein